MLYSVISVETKDFIKDSIDQQQPHTLALYHEDGGGGSAPHQHCSMSFSVPPAPQSGGG